MMFRETLWGNWIHEREIKTCWFMVGVKRKYRYGTEADIQQALKKFPDSSVSSLIRVGWCEEGLPPPKTRSIFPRNRQLPYGNETRFS